MSEKVRNYWEQLRSSFWFVPSVMSTMAGFLALGLLQLDIAYPNVIETIPFVYSGGADGTRGLLSAIAGSSITVAGTTFSITIAVLTLASSTYGPRVLRTFTRNTGNQVVLGTFVATFVYSLIVLRAVRGVEEQLFVPYLSTTVAIGLAVANIAVLIYFIHHVTVSIQASTIIAQVGDDLCRAIEHLYPQRFGHGAEGNEERHGTTDALPWKRDSVAICSPDSGYIQTIDDQQLMALSTKHNMVVKVEHRPGAFVVKGDDVLHVWSPEHITDDLKVQLGAAFGFGKERTLTQDVTFGIWQLVDVAIRALSPSLNDPYTAVNCLHQISVALCLLADRDFPPPNRYDEGNRLRVVASPVTFGQMLDVAFNEIRQNGKQFGMVLTTMLDTIGVIAARVQSVDALDALRHHAQLIERSSYEGIANAYDRHKVTAQWEAAIHIIQTRQLVLQAEQLLTTE
jgi:uncharacterized membrane protein